MTQIFDVQVFRFSELDESGVFFGHPDQVELDVIIRVRVLILCKIKSSMSREEMYTFERKARFYEQRHGRCATQLFVISPMVDQYAKKVAEKLGVVVCSDAEDGDPKLFETDTDTNSTSAAKKDL